MNFTDYKKKVDHLRNLMKKKGGNIFGPTPLPEYQYSKGSKNQMYTAYASRYKGKLLDGFQILMECTGRKCVYTISEYGAGPAGDEMHIYGYYKTAAGAVNKLAKIAKQKKKGTCGKPIEIFK